MPLSVYPDQPDDKLLSAYIAVIPGGSRYIGDAWRTEQRVFVGVDIGRDTIDVIGDIAAAYPPRPAAGFVQGDDHDEALGFGRLLFCVPLTVAEILAWNLPSEDTHVDRVDVTEMEGLEPDADMPYVLRLWEACLEAGDDWYDFEKLAQAMALFKRLTFTAKREQVDFRPLVDVVATLWAEATADVGEDEITAGAVALLRSPGPRPTASA